MRCAFVGEEEDGCTLSPGILTQARNCPSMNKPRQRGSLVLSLQIPTHYGMGGGVGRADGIQGVLWIRLASAAVLEAEAFPGRIWQEQ